MVAYFLHLHKILKTGFTVVTQLFGDPFLGAFKITVTSFNSKNKKKISV